MTTKSKTIHNLFQQCKNIPQTVRSKIYPKKFDHTSFKVQECGPVWPWWHNDSTFRSEFKVTVNTTVGLSGLDTCGLGGGLYSTPINAFPSYWKYTVHFKNIPWILNTQSVQFRLQIRSLVRKRTQTLLQSFISRCMKWTNDQVSRLLNSKVLKCYNIAVI